MKIVRSYLEDGGLGAEPVDGPEPGEGVWRVRATPEGEERYFKAFLVFSFYSNWHSTYVVQKLPFKC